MKATHQGLVQFDTRALRPTSPTLPKQEWRVRLHFFIAEGSLGSQSQNHTLKKAVLRASLFKIIFYSSSWASIDESL